MALSKCSISKHLEKTNEDSNGSDRCWYMGNCRLPRCKVSFSKRSRWTNEIEKW